MTCLPGGPCGSPQFLESIRTQTAPCSPEASSAPGRSLPLASEVPSNVPGKRHPGDICVVGRTEWIGGDLWMWFSCIDSETGEAYTVGPVIVTFPKWPKFHIPSPGKVGAALGIGGAAGVIVGGALEALGALAF